MNKCVIVGAGDCNSMLLRKKMVLQQGDLCIAADRGLEYLLEIGVIPNLIIGDMDSVKPEILTQQLEHSDKISIRQLPVEKDDTDMLAAIKEGLIRGYKIFELYGALGGRIDHTIANIQCLLYLLNHGARGILIGKDTNILLIRNEKITFTAQEHKAGKLLSIFAYGQDAIGVTENGLKYSLQDAIVKQEFPIGISNQFTGTDAMIQVKEGMLLICVED